MFATFTPSVRACPPYGGADASRTGTAGPADRR